MLVKFVKNHTPYMAGETARFDDAVARGLIAAGKAQQAGVAPAVETVVQPPPVATPEPAPVVEKPVTEPETVTTVARGNRGGRARRG